MKVLILDAETTFQLIETPRGINKNPSPYLPDNKLVSVGWKFVGNPSVEYHFFYHSAPTLYINAKVSAELLQAALDEADLLVCHNVKFDLSWLLEAGFKYSKRVWCTMIAEYISARSLKIDLSLKGLCERYNLPAKKSELVDEYMDNNIGFDVIPMEIIQEYGIADIISCEALYLEQVKRYANEDKGLEAVRAMSNENCEFLVDVERSGIKIDLEKVAKVEAEYREVQSKLEERMRAIIQEVMGATPISLDSPEQLSWLLYSRKVVDKEKWKSIFNIGMEQRGAVTKPKRRPKLSSADLTKAIRDNTEIIVRTVAVQCKECNGNGFYYKTRKDGSQYKRATACLACNATGVVYNRSEPAVVGGFKFKPRTVNDVADGGFKTDGDTLEVLKVSGSPLAREFIECLLIYTGNNTLLNTFIQGIKRHTGSDGILHPTFMMCVTATARLSSRDPNFHNLPRGKNSRGGVPIRSFVVSRWEGGKIMEVDWATLEFSVAVDLADDKQGKKDIENRVDKHSFTAKTLTDAGQPTNRQDAKPATFKPLYGGTSGTSAERAYYAAFATTHPDITAWHGRLQDEAIRTGRVRIPSGREYAFPNAKRRWDGSSTFATQIKNYPVQGFATADIVPIGNIECFRLLQQARIEHGIKSLFINTIHDSLKADVYPGEEEFMVNLIKKGMGRVPQALIDRFGYQIKVPLRIEIKIGDNWLDMKEIYKD